MQLKQLSSLKNQAKKLRKLLRRYKSVYDFIIFGSFVKDKMVPRDLDIAMIVSSKDPVIVGEVKTAIDKEIKNVHLQLIVYEDFLKSKLPYYILSEGFSVREGRFISKKLNIKRKILYTFDLGGLFQVQKVMFNKGLRSLIASTKSEKVGKGAILVNVSSSGEFEDFFSQWKRKIIKKEFIEI